MGVGWCHRVKGVVHPRCETNHTLSHLHPIRSDVSGHREARRLKPAHFWIWQVFQRKHVSMIQLLWLPRSRWSQVGFLSAADSQWFRLGVPNMQNHRVQSTLEGWQCGNFTTVIILRVTFLHRSENTNAVNCAGTVGSMKVGKKRHVVSPQREGVCNRSICLVVSSLDVTVILHVMVSTNNSSSGFNLGENLKICNYFTSSNFTTTYWSLGDMSTEGGWAFDLDFHC